MQMPSLAWLRENLQEDFETTIRFIFEFVDNNEYDPKITKAIVELFDKPECVASNWLSVDIHDGMLDALKDLRPVFVDKKFGDLLLLKEKPNLKMDKDELALEELIARAGNYSTTKTPSAVISQLAEREYVRMVDAMYAGYADKNPDVYDHLNIVAFGSQDKEAISEGITRRLLDSADMFRGQSQSSLIWDYIKAYEVLDIYNPDHPYISIKKLADRGWIFHVMKNKDEAFCQSPLENEPKYILRSTWNSNKRHHCPECYKFANSIVPSIQGNTDESQWFLSKGQEIHDQVKQEVMSEVDNLIQAKDSLEISKIHKKLRAKQTEIMATANAKSLLETYTSDELWQKFRCDKELYPLMTEEMLVKIMSQGKRGKNGGEVRVQDMVKTARSFELV